MKKIFTLSVVYFCFTGLIYCEHPRILSWQEVFTEAMGKNPALKKAEESVKTARFNYLKSFSSFLPQVNANASANKSGSDTTGDSNNYSYGVSGTLSLFSGLKDLSTVKMKDLDLNSAEADYKRTLSDTVYDLKKSFIELLWSQETVVLSEEILKQRNDNLQLVSLKYEAGNEDKGSLSRVQADKLQSEYDMAKAKRHTESAVFDLLRAIGNSEYEVLAVTGSFSITANYGDFADSIEHFFNDSYKEVPEYLKAENNLKKAKLEKTYSMGDFYPDLSLSAGDSRSGSRWAPQNDGWNVGIRLTYPLFNGGERYFNLKTSASNQIIAEEALRQTKYELFSNYKTALNSFYDAYENIKVSEKYLEASQEQSRVTTAKYINGLATYQEWYAVENDFINAKKNLLNARKNSVITEATLRNIAGLTEGQQ